MSDVAAGYIFSDGPGAVDAARLNLAIGGAEIQVGFITGKSAITPVPGDFLLFYDLSGNVLAKCTLAAAITASTDTRFPASVTGIRKGAGAGATDTAAVAQDFAFAPTTSTPVAGAVTLDCSVSNLFTVPFIVNTTVTLSNIKDGNLICVQITQDGAGSRLLTLVTTQTLIYEGNTAYALSTAANSIDLLFFRRIGSNLLSWVKKDFGP